jgi:hypothetical protein
MWELSRGLTSFFVLGDSLPSLTHSLVSLVYASGYLENHLNSSQPCSTKRPPSIHGLDSFLKKHVRNPFLRAQILIGLCVLLMECSLPRYTYPSSYPFLPFLIEPYSLFPPFHSAIKWLATFFKFNKRVTLFARTEIHPIWLTLGFALASGPSGWKTSAKGLMIAFIVAKIMHLRTDKDEPLVDSVGREIRDWTVSTLTILKRFLIRFYEA